MGKCDELHVVPVRSSATTTEAITLDEMASLTDRISDPNETKDNG